MSVWTADTISPLVRAWDERLRRDLQRFEQLVPEAAARQSVLREPVSEEHITAVEARLRVRLPDSYRAFLGVSNGAYASSLGAETMAHGVPLRHGFLPVEEIAPIAQADPLTVSIWTGMPELMDPARDALSERGSVRDVRYYAPLERGLLISRPHDVFRDVLVPRDGTDEWELWSMAKEGAGAYRSFADFLQYQVERPDYRPKAEQADELVAEVRAGNHPVLMDLVDLGDARAGELAQEIVLEPGLTDAGRIYAINALGRLGDPRYVAALRSAWEGTAMYQARVCLLAALEACGDPDLDQLLSDLAENDRNPQMRRSASARLRRRQDNR